MTGRVLPQRISLCDGVHVLCKVLVHLLQLHPVDLKGLLKSSSHEANWWRLPQPTAIRRIEIKIYTAIDDLILIE